MDTGMPSEPKELPEEEHPTEYPYESTASANPRPRPSWSIKELKKLHRLASTGQPIDVICATLKRTQAAVNGAFSKILLQQIMHSSIEDVAKHYGETVGNLQASLLPPKYHIPMKGSPIVASHRIAGVDADIDADDADIDADTDADIDADTDANEATTDSATESNVSGKSPSNVSVESPRTDSHCFTTTAVFMASFVAIYAYGHYVIRADQLFA